MTKPIALLDACVLFPAPLRDLWMNLIWAEAFEGRWTEQIHEEWIRSALSRRPDLVREKLERTRDLMNVHSDDSLVKGYEPLIESIILPDKNDRHILAAAIHSEVDFVVTFNLKDFPKKVLKGFGLEAIHPDDFASQLLSNRQELFVQGVFEMRANLKNPPKTVEDCLRTLEIQGLSGTVRLLQKLKAFL